MRYVIAVRHGSDTRGELNGIGRGQAERLAEAIARHVAGTGTKKVFTSSMECAVETARVIARALGVRPELCEALLFEECEYELQKDAAEALAGDDCDVLVLVTVGEKSAAGILDCFRHARFFEPIGRQDTMHGTARVLSLVTGEHFLLP